MGIRWNGERKETKKIKIIEKIRVEGRGKRRIQTKQKKGQFVRLCYNFQVLISSG